MPNFDPGRSSDELSAIYISLYFLLSIVLFQFLILCHPPIQTDSVKASSPRSSEVDQFNFSAATPLESHGKTWNPPSYASKIFNIDNDLRLLSTALNSSLWELFALKDHYHPAVSTLCRDIERKWEKHEVKLQMEEFTVQTYRELFDHEVKRKSKATPICFRSPTSFFQLEDCHQGIFSI